MESILRTALVDWLASDPLLATTLNSVTEEVPSRATAPWLAIVASASSDWSTKDRKGREIRVALELQIRGEEAGESGDIASLIEDRIAALPADQTGMRIITTQFLRARAEQRDHLSRAVLLEYRFRALET